MKITGLTIIAILFSLGAWGSSYEPVPGSCKRPVLGQDPLMCSCLVQSTTGNQQADQNTYAPLECVGLKCSDFEDQSFCAGMAKAVCVFSNPSQPGGCKTATYFGSNSDSLQACEALGQDLNDSQSHSHPCPGATEASSWKLEYYR